MMTQAGRVIASKYELLRRLGEGGMGDVWLARHSVLRTEVAVKLLRGREDDPEIRRDILERFRQEAQLSAHVGARTRHVVRVTDFGEDSGDPFLVMDYVRGPSLADELDAGVPLSVERVGAILDQLAEALSVVHEHGIVHRDLKPANVLLGSAADGTLEVKLTDFGIAKSARGLLPIDAARETAAGITVGTPDYMSPEQLEGRGADKRADCWAVGVLAYEMLTGQNPFSAPSLAAVMQRVLATSFPPPSTVRRDLPRAMDAWFSRALARDREKRFGSVRELAATFALLVDPQRTTVAMPLPSVPPVRGAEPEGSAPPSAVSLRPWEAPTEIGPPTTRASRAPVWISAAALAVFGVSVGLGWISSLVSHTARSASAQAGVAAALSRTVARIGSDPTAPPASSAPPISVPPAAPRTAEPRPETRMNPPRPEPRTSPPRRSPSVPPTGSADPSGTF